MASRDVELVSRDDRRVILVGKTGGGKSTLGNLLLDRPDVFPPEDGDEVSTTAVSPHSMSDGFVVGTGFDVETKTSDYKQNTAWGRNLTVVDTPGLFDPSENLTVTLEKMTQGLSLISPGPHAILFVTRCDIRFTDEEKGAFDKIIRVFGESVRPHIIVVFSRGDTLGRRDISRLLAKAPDNLRQVMEVVADKYVVVSHTDDPHKRRDEMENLQTMIDDVSRDGHFTRQEFIALDREIEAEVERVMNEDNIPRRAAEVVVRRGIAQGDERLNELKQKLLLIVVGSAMFGLALGLGGGVATLVMTQAGSLQQVTAAITVALAHLGNFFLRRADDSRPCVIM